MGDWKQQWKVHYHVQDSNTQGGRKIYEVDLLLESIGKQISRINTCSAGLCMAESGHNCIGGSEYGIGKEGWWLSKEPPSQSSKPPSPLYRHQGQLAMAACALHGS